MKKMIFIVICLALSGCAGKRLPPPVKVETYTYPDGGKYVGKFKDGKKNGQGTFTFPDGRKYVGEYNNDVPYGQGTITSPSGYKYEGEWKDGKPDGQGTETFPDGSTYVGEWQNGLPNGQGTKTLPDGRKYVGEWKDAREHGQGIFTSPNGQKYVGEYKDGRKNGQGTFTFPDGNKYVGEFKDGKKNGQGTYTWYDGSKYVGEWKGGEMWNGTIYDKDGNIIKKVVNGIKQVDLTKEHKIPEPDATKESQSLLVIPFSVDYPTNFGTPVKGWGIKFNSRMNKTISFDPKFRQDYLVVEMEPGDYTGSKFIHPDYEGNDYIYGSYPRNRNDLDKSKRKNLRRLSFKLVNKNIKIADFRFTYWQQLGNDGGCCSYYGIIESIDDMVKNRTLDKISKLENFEKWKFTD